MSARRHILAFTSGLVFAIGLGISGMTRPSKVLAFLDVTGAWDPSLLCVMGAALAVTFVAFRWILARPRPLFDERFHLPRKSAIDASLIGGAALFGVGWGSGGFCPGPAIVGFGSAMHSAAIFTGAMLIGMIAVAAFQRSAPTARRHEEFTEVRSPSEARPG
jgi:uncharacterized membrane protein YedE/YeeE